ncbi:MAG TPA: glycosyltransferase family 87 protein [Terriglobales bacterium]|nr:glycosyltransferase family 87 protein [Terriglobales bacterium]
MERARERKSVPPRMLKYSSKIGIAAALLFAASMWFYMQRVLITHQEAEAATHDIPRGNLSDLYPRWLGARELLLRHRDPYSPEITREIQIGYYGRALDSHRAYDPIDQQAFAYPVYVVFLLAPAVFLPFWMVQIGARWFLAVLTAATVLFALRALRWRPSVAKIAIIVILVMGSFQSIQGIKLQQLSLLVSGLLAASAMLLVGGQFVVAGILMALATIKPQLALPLTVAILFWALHNWRLGRKFIFSFAATMMALFIGSEAILPGWIGEFRAAVIDYRRYNNGAGSILDLLFGSAFGKLLTFAVIIAVAFICGRARNVSNDDPIFGRTIALILAATVAITPKAAPYNQVLLIIPVLLIVQCASQLWAGSFLSRSCFVIATLLFSWPWLAALAITVASLFLPAPELLKAWSLPIYTSLLIPLIVFVEVTFVCSKLNFSSRGW